MDVWVKWSYGRGCIVDRYRYVVTFSCPCICIDRGVRFAFSCIARTTYHNENQESHSPTSRPSTVLPIPHLVHHEMALSGAAQRGRRRAAPTLTSFSRAGESRYVYRSPRLHNKSVTTTTRGIVTTPRSSTRLFAVRVNEQTSNTTDGRDFVPRKHESAAKTTRSVVTNESKTNTIPDKKSTIRDI